MNDTLSLLLVTTVLTVGGLGLYFYKNTDDDKTGGNSYNEDEIFGYNKEAYDDEENISEPEIFEPKIRSRGGKTKTKRNKRNTGTKRR
jgi:hypothetical protein